MATRRHDHTPQRLLVRLVACAGQAKQATRLTSAMEAGYAQRPLILRQRPCHCVGEPTRAKRRCALHPQPQVSFGDHPFMGSTAAKWTSVRARPSGRPRRSAEQAPSAARLQPGVSGSGGPRQAGAAMSYFSRAWEASGPAFHPWSPGHAIRRSICPGGAVISSMRPGR